jgi:hypothetical protein
LIWPPTSGLGCGRNTYIRIHLPAISRARYEGHLVDE